MGRLELVFSGAEALLASWAVLALDNYRRVSGHLGFFHAAGHVHHRLTFYDAACVGYEGRFNAQGRGRAASFQAFVAFSAAAVDVQGLHSEAYSQLYWEPDAQVRRRALIPPAALLPSPALRAGPGRLPPPLPQLTTPLPLPKPPKPVLDPLLII